MRAFAGLVSDPFFMDVEAALRTDLSGRLSFDTAANTVQFRDVLSIVVEVPFAPIIERFNGVTLIAAIAENIVTRRGKPIRIERLGRPEIKNFVLANPTRDTNTKGVELRDLYNREDAFALSRDIDDSTSCGSMRTWPSSMVSMARPRGRRTRWTPSATRSPHQRFFDRRSRASFRPGSFLEIERALIDNRPHKTAGGRWLDDDILDELLTLMVSGGQGERLGDGVDAPSRPASLSFPYVREPNNRTDLPIPAFLRS